MPSGRFGAEGAERKRALEVFVAEFVDAVDRARPAADDSGRDHWLCLGRLEGSARRVLDWRGAARRSSATCHFLHQFALSLFGEPTLFLKVQRPRLVADGHYYVGRRVS